MCIKIGNKKYDSSKPLEDQLVRASKVVIAYDPKDPDMDKFIDEMERLAKTGISCNVNLILSHNNHIKGVKARDQLKRLQKDLTLNEAIKALVNIHSELDKRLASISVFCRDR